MAENEKWAQIVRRAWEEPDFKQRLITNTNEVLKEYDIQVSEGVTYRIVEDELKGTRYLVLPPKLPDDGDGSLRVDDFGRDVESGDPGF
ncbi:MAG TPA: nitrile hydratase subunit alpha [Polyangiaceae bacterium]|nr:nitrile hydratase subunit alpha [Polyangiaceae bacterium]